MTDRMSADDFQAKHGKPPKKPAKSTGEDGTYWTCGKHEGWDPLPIPPRCPRCGDTINTWARRSGQVAKRLMTEWEGRQG